MSAYLLSDATDDRQGQNVLKGTAALANAGKNFVETLEETFKENKGVAIGTCIGIAAAVTGLIYLGVKNSKKKATLPECVIEYFDSIDKGEMDSEKIDAVLDYLSGTTKQRFTMTSDQFALIVGVVKEYTMKLALENNVDTNKIQGKKHVRMEEYLELQKRIFESA